MTLKKRLKEVELAIPKYATTITLGDYPNAITQVIQAFTESGWLNPALPLPSVLADGQTILISGQEWYERFNNEVGLISPDKAYSILKSKGPSGIYQYVVEAAKRASGVSG